MQEQTPHTVSSFIEGCLNGIVFNLKLYLNGAGFLHFLANTSVVSNIVGFAPHIQVQVATTYQVLMYR